MVMILIISGVIMPALMWFLLYFNITDQYIEAEDGGELLVETKAEAQRDVLTRTVKSPFFWIYMIYANVCTFAALCSTNAFGIGDWYFSL